jgi:clan AA aspartic protease
MIQGTYIVGKGPVIPLRIRGPDGSELDVSTVVDTGFTAALTLPDKIIGALSLAFDSYGELILGDGTSRQFKVYIAEVLWDGAWRSVLATVLGDEVLIGMRMLAGHRLQIDALPGGTVEIARLP